MKTSLGTRELTGYAAAQCAHFFPDGRVDDVDSVALLVGRALDRVERCFSKIRLKYYHLDGVPTFDHLHGDHYATFLYFLSKEALEAGHELLYKKAALLSKCLHGIDLFGHVVMPDVFLLVHPIGTVVGRATFGDYLVLYQNVVVGGRHSKDGTPVYPTLGEGVALYSKSSVLGGVTIGDNVAVAANTLLIRGQFPANSIVTGQHPATTLRPASQSVRARHFGQPEPEG